ncbi:MSP domain protein [Ancylostoma duodenale]|uniref:Major sperm protein n=1 Tax=Ancylostoma duodenale TaxID=51022 RepID=A0A0C2CUE1_9BILA|nr:MSP domain protein [Ancylostoma duodenale]
MDAESNKSEKDKGQSEKEKPEKNLSVDPDIRCSNNNLYRVSPNAMFIEPGQCQNLVVVRMAGPARSDKLILQFLPCDKDAEDCKEFFKQADKNGMKPETTRISLKMVGDQGYRVIPSREVTDDAIS